VDGRASCDERFQYPGLKPRRIGMWGADGSDHTPCQGSQVMFLSRWMERRSCRRALFQYGGLKPRGIGMWEAGERWLTRFRLPHVRLGRL